MNYRSFGVCFGRRFSRVAVINAVIVQHSQIVLQRVPARLDRENQREQIEQIMSSLKRDVCFLKPRLEVLFRALLRVEARCVVVWIFPRPRLPL